METAARVLAHQFSTSAGAARINLRGISEAEALAGIDEGSSPNWVLGHIVLMRRHVHDLLGIPEAEGTPQVDPYARGSKAPGADDAVRLRDLLGILKASQTAVDAELAGAGPALFERPLEQPGGLMGETVGTSLAFLAFHESYHVGQLGTLRRVVGKPGAIV